MAHHVVNHLLQEHGFAHPRTAKQPGLAPLLQRNQHIDGLNAGEEDFGLGGARHQGWRQLVNGVARERRQGRSVVDGVAKYIEHPAQQLRAHGHRQGLARRGYSHPAGQALGRVQGDAAHAVVVELSQHLNHHRLPGPRIQHRVNGRQLVFKPPIHHAAPHRQDVAIGAGGGRPGFRWMSLRIHSVKKALAGVPQALGIDKGKAKLAAFPTVSIDQSHG